jgi:hypothetical protein
LRTKATEFSLVYGHTVVTLLPHTCDLNLIEIAWAKLKRNVHENATADLSLQKLLVAKDALAHMTKEDWEGFSRHIVTVGKQYWERDGIILEVTDHVVINLSPGSDSDNDCESSDTDSQSNCDSSETDMECSNIMPDKDIDMELA